MKRIIELTFETEKYLTDCLDSYLKEHGFSGHAIVNKIINQIKLIQDPSSPANQQNTE